MAISQIYQPIFTNTTNYLKYIVLFILYVFAFHYLFINNTIPISFLLLLFLHIFIIGLIISDSKKLNLGDFKFDHLHGFSTFFKNLIYIGPVISWLLLLISLSIIVFIIFQLKYYHNKGGDVFNLGENDGNEFTSFRIILICSYIIFAFLYGVNLSGILQVKDNNYLQKGQINSLINRVLMTTILLISFLLYFRLISVKNYTFFWITMMSIGFLYIFNFLYEIKSNLIFSNLKVITIIISILCFIGLFIIMGHLVSFIFYKKYDSLIALIPLLVWFIYLIYMGVCLFNKANTVLNFNFSYIIIMLITVLYILSGIALYYAIKSKTYFTPVNT